MSHEALSTRRDLLRVLTHGAIATALVPRAVLTGETRVQALWPGYPRQDQKLVSEVVGAAHFDEKRVRELVKAYPELVNAWWDWGYGDWESPLGAAAHVGDRAIAEFLLASGARMDIFAAAMLGQTRVVRAFIEAQPGIQSSLGPHNITLLAHAEAGGETAYETVEYLKSIKGAGTSPKTEALSTGAMQRYLGEYVAEETGLTMVCRVNRNDQIVADFRTESNQSNGRLLRYIGNDAFFPAGVPSVVVAFTLTVGRATAATVKGSVPEIRLSRRA